MTWIASTVTTTITQTTITIRVTRHQHLYPLMTSTKMLTITVVKAITHIWMDSQRHIIIIMLSITTETIIISITVQTPRYNRKVNSIIRNKAFMDTWTKTSRITILPMTKDTTTITITVIRARGRAITLIITRGSTGTKDIWRGLLCNIWFKYMFFYYTPNSSIIFLRKIQLWYCTAFYWLVALRCWEHKFHWTEWTNLVRKNDQNAYGFS